MFHACVTRFDVTENLENFLLTRLWSVAISTFNQPAGRCREQRPPGAVERKPGLAEMSG